MDGAGFIIAINLSVAGLLAAAFLAIALYDVERVAARWFALGYALGMLNFALEFAVPLAGGSLVVVAAAYTAFLLALAVFNAGLARLYDQSIPWKPMLAILIGGVVLKIASDALPRDSITRQALYQFPYFVMQVVGLLIVLKAPRRSRLEQSLAAVLAVSALHYLTKPLIAAASGGVGAGPQAYLGTTYALFSQSLGTVLAMAVALLLLLVLVRDIVAEITEQSRTDKLSGVLNRRGFEERRDLAMQRRTINGLPVSLVICDLDNFKSVNDTLGHAAGDLVITAFGRLLEDSISADQFVGRIGGEEFAIMLPGSNLAAARLFAESVRHGFQVGHISGLPASRRFTASFGVAQARNGESPQELQARADAALYEAKRAGRDRVHAASPMAEKKPAASRSA